MTEFDKWLTETEQRRSEIIAFSKIPVLDVDKAIEFSAEMGMMENQADSYAKLALAAALRDSRAKYPEYSAKYREILVRADLDPYFKFSKDLAIIGRVLRDRIYNRNASR